MHELAIAQGIIRAVDESVPADDPASIIRIIISVGELTAVQEECLKFAYEAIIPGTRMEGSELILEYVKPLFKCRKCQRKYEPKQGLFSACPQCGDHGMDVLEGNELYVKTVELESGE